MHQRTTVILLYLCVMAVLTAGVWRYAYQRGLDQLAARGKSDLALAGDRLVGQLQRYRDLAVFMAAHPEIKDALGSGERSGLQALLQKAADKSAALDLLVLDASGKLQASAFGTFPENMAHQPYVQRALSGALGWGHDAAAPVTARAFYHVAPVFDGAGNVPGVVVVIKDLNGIDYNWRGTNPAVFFTDAMGEVYVANRSELLSWRRLEGEAGLIPPDGKAAAFRSWTMQGHEIWRVAWSPYLPREGLHLTQTLPVIGMTGEVLLDIAQTKRFAYTQAAAVAALFLAFGSLLFLASERRRALARVNAQLESHVADRTRALRASNASLRREAIEREEAQAALRRAQDDLVQAGKLSALGQMSAGISHELNQPLMAMRSFAENAAQFIQRGRTDRASENLTRISDMANRMGRIIQNLRAFARQEDMPQGRVDLVTVAQDAIELTHRHLTDAGVALDFSPPPGPIWVRGGAVRLSQVFVNLITNAVDAMSESEEKKLRISISGTQAISVCFQDTGPGVEMPDKVFDPFYSTKKADGMGLGLSISYGIVQSFGGDIKGQNRADGGAEFTVTLEAAPPREVAA
ncbi:MAG: ATP-binding protein [Pseudomonadota bacterium]